MTDRDSIIREIATRTLSIETLETRKRDSFDFHEIPVWAIRKALEAAYEAGLAAGRK
ncbi:MAG: hypothetical protein HZC25_08755 [Rhodospirillales bacterium]|nr:hypothetical protein [Rhodospirillales bacterium]